MYNRTYMNNSYGNDERFLGSFLGPFILGGITGGVVAPYFWNGKGNTNYNYYHPYPYYPYPVNGPYYQYYTYY